MGFHRQFQCGSILTVIMQPVGLCRIQNGAASTSDIFLNMFALFAFIKTAFRI